MRVVVENLRRIYVNGLGRHRDFTQAARILGHGYFAIKIRKISMRFDTKNIRGIAALFTGFLLCAVSGQVRAQFSGNVALTSDYVWRGSSQTRENPALQGGFKYAHDSGFYASIWG
ncbi:MAG: TorF family putative porin, partial [Comamonas sp.]